MSQLEQSTPFSNKCIICDNDMEFCALGPCNHPICSICALRIRFKSKDNKCPVCKQSNELLVVSPLVAGGCPRHENFELFGQSAGGGVMLQEATMLFIKCHPHYHQLKALISFQCPIPQCNSRFNNQHGLVTHLTNKHQKHACEVCLNHSTLFMSEHTLYASKKELQRHMESVVTASNVATGHPLCQFCKEAYYDAADLFNHMRTAHFTCRYCPIEYQHRYYRNTESLQQHVSHAHLTCPHPDCTVALVAFRSHEDYSDHLLAYHNAQASDHRLRLGFHYQTPPQSSQPATRGISYLDLHAASADPNVPIERPMSEQQARINAGISLVSSSHMAIPSNMRIAGKIRNGRVVQRDESDELLEQALTAGQAPARRGKTKIKATLEEFPSLASTPAALQVRQEKAPVQSTQALHEPHPLSLMTKERRQKALETERKKREEQEEQLRREHDEAEKRRKRNEDMAKALGLSHRSQEDLAEDIAAGGVFAPSIQLAQLQVPVFTTELIGWTKNNEVEVLRIERKLQTFLADKSATSLSLKPMKSFYRDLVHDLAKYYQLNSHEYDPEPQRYVALVKSIETQSPSILLSQASKQHIVVLTHQLQELNTPTLYFSLKYSGAGMTLTTFVQKLNNEISQMRYDWRSSETRPLIVDVRLNGPCGVVVVCTSFELAAEIYAQIIEVRVVAAARTTQTLTTIQGVLLNRAFFDLFDIEPAFHVDQYLSSHEVLYVGAMAAASARSQQDMHSREASFSGTQPPSDWSPEAPVEGDSIVVNPALVSQVSSDNNYLDWQFEVGGHVSVAFAVEASAIPDDWEDDAEGDETVVEAISAQEYAEESRGEEKEDEDGSAAPPVECAEDLSALEMWARQAAPKPSSYQRLRLEPRVSAPPLAPLPERASAPKPAATRSTKPPASTRANIKQASIASDVRPNRFDAFGVESSDEDDDEGKVDAGSISWCAIASQAGSEATSGWTCQVCTFQNSEAQDAEGDIRICSICDSLQSSV